MPGPRELAPGKDTLELKLQATTASGDKVVQTLTFHRGSYVIDVSYQITNAGAAPIAPYAYFQLTRDTKTPDVQSSMAPAAYTGPVIYNETDKFKKVEPGDLDKLAADPTRKLPYTKNADNGWVGMIEHYFLAAWLPADSPQDIARVLREEARQRAVRRRRDPAGWRRSRRAPRARSRSRSTSDRRNRTRSRNSQPVSISWSTTAFSRCSRRRCSGC